MCQERALGKEKPSFMLPVVERNKFRSVENGGRLRGLVPKCCKELRSRFFGFPHSRTDFSRLMACQRYFPVGYGELMDWEISSATCGKICRWRRSSNTSLMMA